MVNATRRGVLRGSAALGGGVLAPVSVASAQNDRDAGDEMGVAARDLLSYQDHINVPGYHYVGSIRREEFCYWAASACIHLAAITWAAKSLATAAPIGAVCAVEASSCRLLQDLERLTPYEFDWIHVYWVEGWLSGVAGLPDWLLVPEPTTNPSDRQMMVTEAVAQLNTDDGKIGSGELSKAINAWSTGGTIPGTDHKVSTDNLLIMIEFWAKGKSVR